MPTYPLSVDELSSLYYELSKQGAYCIGENKFHFESLSLEEILAIAIENSRWDIRLLYILIDFFINNFEDIRPFKLRNLIMRNKTPQVIGVISEFCRKTKPSDDLHLFFKLITDIIKPLPYHCMFHLGTAFIHSKIVEDSERSLIEFKNWGFLFAEVPIFRHLSYTSKPLTHYSKDERIAILMSLLKTKGEITLSDYLAAIQFSITRQHARLDLLSQKNIRSNGHTKGTRYALRI